MRLLAAALAALILTASHAQASSLFHRGGAAAPVTYQGPCDLVAGGCSAAYSFSRSMRAAYTGNLFKLTRASDSTSLDIGQSTGSVVDQAAIDTFCKNTMCRYSKVYDHSGNGNDITPGSTVVPPYSVDAAYNLPRYYYASGVNGGAGFYYYWQQPSGLSNHTPTGLPVGTGSKSAFEYSDPSLYSACCGHFGLGYYPVSGDGGASEKGELFGTTFYEPSLPTVNHYFGVEIEYDSAIPAANTWNGVYGSDFANIQGTVIFDSGTNKISAYVNGAQVLAPIAPGYAINTGVTGGPEISITLMGDATTVPVAMYEGAVTNHAMSAPEIAAVNTNITNFYTARAAASCGTSLIDTVGYGGWGMRRLTKSYTGPLVRLIRASDSATLDVGTATAGGCDFDAASAATFCNATTCKASIVYAQALLVKDAQSGTFDMIQGTDAARPTYVASCSLLNNKPCLRFAGAQTMCTAALTAATVGTDSFAHNGVKADGALGTNVPGTAYIVAARTGLTTSSNAVLGGRATVGPFVGWANSANTAVVDLASAGGHAVTRAATDNAGHLIAYTTPGTNGVNLIVDGNSTSGTSLGNSSPQGYCLGSQGNGAAGTWFSGDFGEAADMLTERPAAYLTALLTDVRAFWGTP